MVVSWVVMALLTTLAVVTRVKFKNFDPKRPTGFQNVIEMAVDSFDKFYRGIAGDKLGYIAPWFFTIFTFVLTANVIGAFGFRPPMADWAMTFPMAFVSFCLFTFGALRYRPKAYIKGLFEPIFLFFPINLIGELAF